MPATNVLSNLLVTVYNNEMRKKRRCTVIPASNFAGEVLKLMKNHGYIEDYQYIEDRRGGKFEISLFAKINKCGSIMPRFSVKKDQYTSWERQYLPSYNRGILIVSTPEGVMSHHDAQQKGVGGVLIGYVY
ncbi:MAG: 30S ribosomal protein S8 [Nitrososphaerales archaeon]